MECECCGKELAQNDPQVRIEDGSGDGSRIIEWGYAISPAEIFCY